jgi:alkylated DNA repair dioxygenase AlkB
MLKPTTATEIPGLKYLPDYIEAMCERELLATIDAQPWRTELHRQVQQYGYKYDYKKRQVTPDMWLGPLPAWLGVLCEQLLDRRQLPRPANQVIVNEYMAGQGITPHVDCVPCFEDTIASLSLGSPCVMRFTRVKTREAVEMLLEPRSMLVLSGEARYQWRHEIPARKRDRWADHVISRGRRVSVTFRTVRIAA